jgi:hypothetical protein
MDAAKINELAERARQYSGMKLNEEQTKNTLILPFIKSLGYDIFNPFEVKAEFTSDIGTKKGERIDYAIMRGDKPAILIECKPRGDCLDKGRCTQLRRYFQSHIEAKIGVLTDGVRYAFFTDIRHKNIMDDEPFLEFSLLDFDERLLSSLGKICKDKLAPDEFIRVADSLTQGEAIKRMVAEEMNGPSDELVRFFASKASQSMRMSAKAVEIMRPVVRKAVDDFIAARVSLVADTAKVKHNKSLHDESPEEDGVYTTNTEIWGLLIIRTLLHEVIDPLRIAIRDKKSYCGILLDDNNRKSICRFHHFKDWVGMTRTSVKRRMCRYSPLKKAKNFRCNTLTTFTR